jgi:hypothetical protein
MDPKGKGMVVNDKEKESLFNEPRDDKPADSGSSHKKRDGKKKRRIKKIIYYDSDASFSSPRDDDEDDSSSKKKTVNQNYSFDYSSIPYNSNAQLLIQCPVRQRARSCNGRLCPIWKEITHQTCYSSCPVAHRPVRCATRQKARMAFQVCLQRLLAALGL